MSTGNNNKDWRSFFLWLITMVTITLVGISYQNASSNYKALAVKVDLVESFNKWAFGRITCLEQWQDEVLMTQGKQPPKRPEVSK
jgi:hypothetical protein